MHRRFHVETVAIVRDNEPKLFFFTRQADMDFPAAAVAHGILQCFLEDTIKAERHGWIEDSRHIVMFEMNANACRP